MRSCVGKSTRGFLFFFGVFRVFFFGQVIQTTFKGPVPPALDRDYQSCIIRESAVRSLPSFRKTALVDKLVESRSRHLPHREPEAGHHLAVRGGQPFCVEQAETCQVLAFNHGRPRPECRPLLHCCVRIRRAKNKVCATLVAGTPSRLRVFFLVVSLISALYYTFTYTHIHSISKTTINGIQR